MTPPRITTARHTAENTIRENDYVTMAQCAKIAAGLAERVAERLVTAERERVLKDIERMIAQALAERDRARRRNRWHRRLRRWLRGRLS